MTVRQLTPRLPLAPLLHAYAQEGLLSPGELHSLPGLGPRCAAVLSATARFLCADFLDSATEDDFREAITRFHDAVTPPPLHAETLRRRAGFVRHALTYLVRGQDSLPAKVEAVLSAGGAYRVPGLGPSFWSAVLQGLNPARNPGWMPATIAGLERLGLARWSGRQAGAVYAGLLDAHARVRALQPEMSALHIDHFLSLVAAMDGRTLPSRQATPVCPIVAAVRAVRAALPLRDRLKTRGQALADAQERLEAALGTADGKGIGAALAVADEEGSGRALLDWGAHVETLALWVGRLWEADDPYPLLARFWQEDELPGAGLWLPAAVLHLRDPQRWFPWNEAARAGLATLDDSDTPADPPAERYRLFNEGCAWLRQRHSLHPLELPAVLAALAARPEEAFFSRANGSSPKESGFHGFCADTFRFLAELGHDNRRDWMEAQRDRYGFAVRGPLTELCRALAQRYVEPVLCRGHGWDLDTEARPGRALTRILKNSFGQPRPYHTALWIAFCPRNSDGARPARRAGPQLFVRLDSAGLRYGLRLGRSAGPARDRLRHNASHHAGALFRALGASGALEACRFGPADAPERLRVVEDVEDLARWASGRTAEASRSLIAGDPLLASEDLVGEVLLTFDRLLSAFACAAEADAAGTLAQHAGAPSSAEGYGEADFRRATFLDGGWLRRALDLLSLKKQLILQGVPGTGKTHVARCLARLLAGGHDEAVRLVQFHPAYSYEEFVEGIKVRSVAVDGRHDVTYPVEDGLLCAFAAEAAARPSQTHVLVIDELNRGNLPRIFGELLYLLEYRNQAVTLPCSRRAFQLPANLVVVATMNAADQSVARLDQALRRRFSFLEMSPDPGVLAGWLHIHPPLGGRPLAERVLLLFERLNSKLVAEVGVQARIGHSYFMVHDLDEERLGMIWRHHVRPLVEEHLAGQPGRLAAYDQLFEAAPRTARRRPVPEPTV
jgi:hypothetical protein